MAQRSRLPGFLGLFVALAISRTVWGQVVTASYTPGPSTRLVAQDTVLENDLTYHAGDAQYRSGQYPQAAVIRWSPITSDRPGRYRVSLRARTASWGESPLVLQAWVPAETGGTIFPTNNGPVPVTIAAKSLNGYAFNMPGQWQSFSLDFDVEKGETVSVGLMYVGKDSCLAGKIQVEVASLKLEKLPLPVCISWARPVKVRYQHREHGAIEYHVTNSTAQVQNILLRPSITSETGERTVGKTTAVKILPLSTGYGTIPFAIPVADGGYKADCELIDGDTCIDRRGDVFAVADNPFRCMIAGPGPYPIPYLLPSAFSLGVQGFKDTVLGHWDDYTKNCALAVELMRRSYVTYFEYFAWAHDDAIKLTEDTDEPYLADQCSWPVSRKQLKLINSLFTNHGIAPSAYVNGSSFGWLGFELLRKRPEWYAIDKTTGQPDVYFDTAYQEKYYKHEQQATYYPAMKANFFAVSPVDGQTYLDFHWKELAASAAMYGWEAYRYDAGPLPADVFPIIKKRLAQLKSPVAIGTNLGVACLGSESNAVWGVYCRQESLMMEENITFPFFTPTDPYRRWNDWINYLRVSYSLAHRNGAHYTYINGAGNWLSTALGYAMGGHSAGTYTDIKSPYGDYERFMIRYGSYFWDLRKQLLSDPEKILSVSSGRQLCWRPFASQRQLAPRHRQVIVPLFNPPAEGEVIGTTGVTPVDDAQVIFSPDKGEKVSAWLLAPEPDAQRAILPIKQHDGKILVDMPRFWGWTNIVFDCQR